MAHLLRKIRKFRDTFPHRSTIVKFYVKLRRILRDGERLQKGSQKIGGKGFSKTSEQAEKEIREIIKVA